MQKKGEEGGSLIQGDGGRKDGKGGSSSSFLSCCQSEETARFLIGLSGAVAAGAASLLPPSPPPAFIRALSSTTGVVGGSVLVPSEYADDGIVFVPSMGIGVILVTPLGFPLQLILQGGDLRHIPDFMVWETLPFGVLAGAIYGAATIVQILAIDALDCKCQPRIASVSLPSP